MAEQAASDAARALAALRRKERKRCPYCGKEFEGIKTAAYCSHACAMADYRDNNRDALNAKRRERYRRQRADQ